MEDKSNISIFQGSAVEADTVHDYLAENNIGSLVRNHMQENLDAGWVTASPDNAAEVFVSKADQPKAQELLKNLYHDEEAPAAGSVQKANATIVKPATAPENQQTPPSNLPPRA